MEEYLNLTENIHQVLWSGCDDYSQACSWVWPHGSQTDRAGSSLLTLTSCLARLVRREERQTELGRCHCEVTVRSLSHWVTSACPAPLAARARLSWAWLAAPPPGALSSEHQAGGNSFNNVPEGYNTTQHYTTHTQLGWQHQAALLLTTLWKVVSLHARKVRFIPRNSLLSSIIKHNLYFCWRL